MDCSDILLDFNKYNFIFQVSCCHARKWVGQYVIRKSKLDYISVERIIVNNVRQQIYSEILIHCYAKG